MNELFLQYLWQNKLIRCTNLFAADNEKVEILSFGTLNKNAGPDFLNCKIKIGKTVWAGNVEIHLKSSDWYKHKHHQNKQYDNIILHVVNEHDMDVKRINGEVIQTLVLDGQYDKSLQENYKKVLDSKSSLACQKNLSFLSPDIFHLWIETLLKERLKKKAINIEKILAEQNNDWVQTLNELLFYNFGFKTNAIPFKMLIESIPSSIFHKHKNDLFQIEAILFGQAGLLNNEFKDIYPASLFKEYSFLRKKYLLTPINSSIWRFSRMRPTNFPHIRIAQLAQLIHGSSFLFSQVVEKRECSSYKKILRVKASKYWDTHYIFDKESTNAPKHIGYSSIDSIIINAFIPILYAYGSQKEDNNIKEEAFKLLENIKPEKNHITKKWEEAGVISSSAYQTQALIELTNTYCHLKKCLNCMIGKFLLKNLNA